MDSFAAFYNAKPPSPPHSPSHTPSPNTSPGQTYPAPSSVPMYYPPLSKLPPKMQPHPIGHPFGPHPLLPQASGPPAPPLGPPQGLVSQQPPLNVALSSSIGNPLGANVDSRHWQQQLNCAQLSRQSASPHHHARQAAAASRTSLGNLNNLGNPGSAAVAITDPNHPNKPPVNGTSQKKQASSDDNQWVIIDLGGMGLKNISPELFRYNFLTTLYISHNNLTYLSSEISELRCLRLLDASGNKLQSLPPELGMLTSLRELLLFDNGITGLPWELGALYRLKTLGLEGNPASEVFKSLLQKEGASAVIAYLRDNGPDLPQPAEREWIVLDNDGTNGGPDVFKLLCYNILCEKYATPQAYGYTPSWALAWDWRKDLILEDVLMYSADIVCLQEVDITQYEEFFRDEMSSRGDYDSVYWPKSRAKTMGELERKTVDGCATFFKSSKFSLIDKHLIEFSQVALQRSDFKKTEDMINRVITKDNIAIVTLLENKENLYRLVVVNCHIHWDPSSADVKLVQVAMLMDELEKLTQKWSSIPSRNSAYSYSSPQKMATIVCGDFNSTPDSGVFELLSRGSVRPSHPDFGTHTYGAFASEGLSQNFSLKSSYSNTDELQFTNFTPNFSGVIDYIWYGTNTLTVTGLLGGIDKEYLPKVVGFPNAHFASDHVVILAEFRYKPSPQATQSAPQFSNSSSNRNRGQNHYHRRMNS